MNFKQQRHAGNCLKISSTRTSTNKDYNDHLVKVKIFSGHEKEVFKNIYALNSAKVYVFRLFYNLMF